MWKYKKNLLQHGVQSQKPIIPLLTNIYNNYMIESK